MNNCSFSGRITKDPELKATEGGTTYLKFCLAVKRFVKSGEHPQSDFIDCVAWNKTAELIKAYCKKGSLIGVTGRLQSNTYDKNGEKRKSVEIIVNELDFIDTKNGEGEQSPAPAPTAPNAAELPFEI